MVADLVPPGSVVADIGSDHAYLPVYLVQAGVCQRAIAADVGAGPLANARKAVGAAGLDDSIELRRSNGFARFTESDADCWVLSGMGGTLMVRLLEAAPWLCASGTVLVCQPMRHAWELRQWLVSHGFVIAKETACYESGRAYCALRAEYNVKDEICNVKSGAGYAYYGELPRYPHPAAREFLARELRLLETRAEHCEELKEALHDLRARCI
jgi:tRNA (adenine22-N1)-methyltransferase